jgi:hypothetical protein
MVIFFIEWINALAVLIRIEPTIQRCNYLPLPIFVQQIILYE